jgi:thiol:disulfide interchange protein DsbA
MKRRDFALAASAGLPLWALAQGPAPAKPAPQEGIEYVTLDKRVPAESNDGKIEVIEFFWYSCPHCNAFEPRFAQWVKSAPKDVVVRRVPVRFRDDFEPQQRMFYTLEAMGKLEALHVKLFTAIHGEKQKLDTFDTLSAWAVKNGLDKAKFTEVFNSFGVATKARRATQLQEAFKVQGVPSLGVAGRFYTDGSLASNMESALGVTEYLIGQVRKGR